MLSLAVAHVDTCDCRNRSIHLIGGRKMEHCGFVLAADGRRGKVRLDDQKRRRLAVNPIQ
jgi:hypothetical protein